MSKYLDPPRARNMNPKTWSLRDWMNFCAAIPALFSLGTLLVCGVPLVMFWLVYSGYAVIVAAGIVLFFSALVITRAALRNGWK